MTRFWISLDQGVDFVLSSLEMTRGGEIFVPKIGSMTMPQVADAIAPGLPHRTVGIRPGEKLHEMMISGDDARMTAELPDRYVIEPQFVEYARKAFRTDGGRPVADGFTYSSDTNTEWLDAAGLKALLAGHG
jgi:UDP-N-acetylglucosamine 4,6-dehydratase